MVTFFGCSSVPGNIATEYYNIGNAYFDVQKYDKAIEYYYKALEGKNTAENSIRYNLGISLAETGRFESALEQFELLLSKDPLNLLVLQSVAFVYFLSGDRDLALEYYGKVLAQNEFDSIALYNKAVILKDDDPDGATDLLERLFIADKSARTALLLSDLYEKKGLKKKRVELLEESLSVNQGNTAILERLIDYYSEERVFFKVMNYIDAILRTDSYDRKSEMLFKKAELEFLELDDYSAGFDSLVEALDSGFKDKQKIEALLKNEALSQDSQLRNYMKARGFLD